MLKRLGVVCLCLAIMIVVFALAIAKDGETVCECGIPQDCTSGCDVCVFAEYTGLTDTVYCYSQEEWVQCCSTVEDSVCRWDPDDPIE